MRWFGGLAFFAISALATLVATVEPVLARDPPVQGAPGPLIGVGLPIVGAVVVALMIARSLRRND